MEDPRLLHHLGDRWLSFEVHIDSRLLFIGEDLVEAVCVDSKKLHRKRYEDNVTTQNDKLQRRKNVKEYYSSREGLYNKLDRDELKPFPTDTSVVSTDDKSEMKIKRNNKMKLESPSSREYHMLTKIDCVSRVDRKDCSCDLCFKTIKGDHKKLTTPIINTCAARETSDNERYNDFENSIQIERPNDNIDTDDTKQSNKSDEHISDEESSITGEPNTTDNIYSFEGFSSDEESISSEYLTANEDTDSIAEIDSFKKPISIKELNFDKETSSPEELMTFKGSNSIDKLNKIEQSPYSEISNPVEELLKETNSSGKPNTTENAHPSERLSLDEDSNSPDDTNPIEEFDTIHELYNPKESMSSEESNSIERLNSIKESNGTVKNICKEDDAFENPNTAEGLSSFERSISSTFSEGYNSTEEIDSSERSKLVLRSNQSKSSYHIENSDSSDKTSTVEEHDTSDETSSSFERSMSSFSEGYCSTEEHNSSEMSNNLERSYSPDASNNTEEAHCSTRGASTNDSGNASAVSVELVQVFLGGFVNGSTWREEIAVPALTEMGISFYNPKIMERTMHYLEMEKIIRETSEVLLYVVDNTVSTSESMIELSYLATTDLQIVVVIHPYECGQILDGERLNEQDYYELTSAQVLLRTILERFRIPVFSDVLPAIYFLNDVMKGRLRKGLATSNPKQY